MSSTDNVDIERELIADMYGFMVFEAIEHGMFPHTFGLDTEALNRFRRAFENAMGATEIRDGDQAAELIDHAAQLWAGNDPEYLQAAQGDPMRESVSYDNLVKQRPMKKLEMPPVAKRGHGFKSTAVSDGIKNAKEKNNPLNTDKRIFVRNRYSSTDIQITTGALDHGLVGNDSRQEGNARLSRIIGDAIENAITINELEPKHGANRTYLMAGIAADDTAIYPYTLVVNESSPSERDILEYNALPGVSKEWLYAANSKNGTCRPKAQRIWR